LKCTPEGCIFHFQARQSEALSRRPEMKNASAKRVHFKLYRLPQNGITERNPFPENNCRREARAFQTLPATPKRDHGT
jgi:hypothetical protein